MNKKIGSFWYRRTVSGNLVGESTEGGTKKIYTSSANLKPSPNDSDFTGKYRESWMEKGESAATASDLEKGSEL
jgi:hypothetical protein